jgi:hypothetical protein
MTFFSLLEVYVHAWAKLLSEVDYASGVSSELGSWLRWIVR